MSRDVGLKISGPGLSPKKSALFLILFGMVFLGVGGACGFLSLRTVVRAQAMLAWAETPAAVLTCELKSESDSDGGTTYRLLATYGYEVRGVRYTGDRVSLHSGSDNIGKSHHKRYAVLNDCRTRKQPTTCWVNPQNPADAILFRKPRPEMIIFFQLFTLAFGGAGLAVVLAGVFVRGNRMHVEAGDGLIRMRGTSTHRVLTLIALLWNSYAGWLLWALWRVLAPDPLPWYLWSLAVVGVVLALAAGHRAGRFFKFGVSVFALAPAPGVLGGPVTGSLRIPAMVEAPSGFELRLQCFHRYTERSGGESSTTTVCRWEDWRHAVTGLAYGNETVVPVRFAVPFDQLQTSAVDGGDGIFWRLTATAKAHGVDYKAVFDVPVKKTPQSSAGYAAAQMTDTSVRRDSITDVVRRLSLRLEPRPDGGFELVCPAARSLGNLAVLGVFTVAWSGVCYVLWFVADAPLMFPIVFSLFDVLLLLLLFNGLLVSRGIIFDRGRLECVVWSRLLGIKVSERRVPFGEVLDFQSERSGQSGSTMYYRIVLKRRTGHPLKIAGNLKAWSDVDRIGLLLTAGLQRDFRLEGYRVL